MNYQAKIQTPFGVLGIRCDDAALTGIDFLPTDAVLLAAQTVLAESVCQQLRAYLANAGFVFSLPLRIDATAHRRLVWEALREIPSGQTKSYGQLAAELHSSARAVGQACGANPIPIVIPCHRVLGKSQLGGFMHHVDGEALDIKRWLLAHEGNRR